MRFLLISAVSLSLVAQADAAGERVQSFDAVTMNAGLAPGLERYSPERAKPFAEFIGHSRDAGVVCLQEVWMDKDRDRVIAALGYPPEQVFTANTVGRNERPGLDVCAPRRLRKLETCVRKNCSRERPSDVHICAKRECEWDLRIAFGTPAECGTCLASMAGHSIDETLDVCTGPVGASRIYDGRNGVILASKWPLKNRQVVELPGSGANRVALMATVTVPGAGDIEVACTHISSAKEVAPSHPDFVDWEEEQSFQLKLISDRLAARAGDRPSLVMGDLNVGPKVSETIKASGKDVWNKIVAMGFRDPGSETRPPFCTVCATNKMHDSASSMFIDHVLLREQPGGLTLVPNGASAIGCEPIQLKLRDGSRVTFNLSDHCGLRVGFKIELAPH